MNALKCSSRIVANKINTPKLKMMMAELELYEAYKPIYVLLFASIPGVVGTEVGTDRGSILFPS